MAPFRRRTAMPKTRCLLWVSLLLVLTGCERSQENCLRVTPGMRLSQVLDIMGEPRDSFLLGHPPVGIMLVYGPKSRDKWPQEPEGPIAVEMEDGPSNDPADRTVIKAYCRGH